jgi:hypothetical protein
MELGGRILTTDDVLPGLATLVGMLQVEAFFQCGRGEVGAQRWGRGANPLIPISAPGCSKARAWETALCAGCTYGLG